ncbi:hypothetical protein HanXRQr2_Chr03g0125841 [Helianthus annuus]|uniref:Uncharacterized protein n=1 Tax=Helianthus annuus TaxID=4232 RepID=A0A9K3JIA2_HELAN|nr:hypothetical protein HanXRQr2_Chr03g0125841 [Helianthus annuus]
MGRSIHHPRSTQGWILQASRFRRQKASKTLERQNPEKVPRLDRKVWFVSKCISKNTMVRGTHSFGERGSGHSDQTCFLKLWSFTSCTCFMQVTLIHI